MKYKFRHWKIRLVIRIHDFLFPRCHQNHIAELDLLIKEYDDEEFLLEQLCDKIGATEILESVPEFRAIFAAQLIELRLVKLPENMKPTIILQEGKLNENH